jgi:hypothetical protein
MTTYKLITNNTNTLTMKSLKLSITLILAVFITNTSFSQQASTEPLIIPFSELAPEKQKQYANEKEYLNELEVLSNDDIDKSEKELIESLAIERAQNAEKAKTICNEPKPVSKRAQEIGTAPVPKQSKVGKITAEEDMNNIDEKK